MKSWHPAAWDHGHSLGGPSHPVMVTVRDNNKEYMNQIPSIPILQGGGPHELALIRLAGTGFRV